MWNAQEFASVLERHPNGGTLWTRTHLTVRYLRVFRRRGIVVAVLTEKWAWGDKSSNKVELFVQTPAGVKVAEFPEAKKNPEFLESLLRSPILNSLDMVLLPEIKEFISTPDDTHLATW